MEMPPNATQHFAKQHVEAAEKHFLAVQEILFKEAAEDLRAFERFYNNLALFAGGTIALSITYLGYLKTAARTLRHQELLTVSWLALFACLLLSLAYVVEHLYYSHHAREREYEETKANKLETDAEDIPKMGIANISTPVEIAEFQKPRKEAAKAATQNAARHKKWEKRHRVVWTWAGRLAQIGFALGIGMLLSFAMLNIQGNNSVPMNEDHSPPSSVTHGPC